MKTIIKLLSTVAVLNAVVRSGSVALTYFQFRDATQELATFSGTTTMAVLREQIMSKAAELKVPIADENLAITREGVRTRVQASYVQPVELCPRYVYPASFSFIVDALLAVGQLPVEPPQR